MAICELTGKGKMYGHNVSFSQHKTRKVFKPNIQKKVVYFLGQAHPDRVVKQEAEISEIRWLPIDDAVKWIAFENHRQLLYKAREMINAMG